VQACIKLTFCRTSLLAQCPHSLLVPTIDAPRLCSVTTPGRATTEPQVTLLQLLSTQQLVLQHLPPVHARSMGGYAATAAATAALLPLGCLQNGTA